MDIFDYPYRSFNNLVTGTKLRFFPQLNESSSPLLIAYIIEVAIFLQVIDRIDKPSPQVRTRGVV